MKNNEKKNDFLTEIVNHKLNILNTQVSMSVRTFFLVFSGMLLVNLSAIGALLLRFEFIMPNIYFPKYVSMAWAVTLSMVFVFWMFSYRQNTEGEILL